jgi:hypothetical protein
MGKILPHRMKDMEASPMFEQGFSRDDYHTFSFADCEFEMIWNISLPEHQVKYEKLINDIGAEVIIFDNYSTCQRRVDQFDSEIKIWERIQPWFVRLRQQGKTIILVHHTNKEGKQSGVKSKENAVDYIVRLQQSNIDPIADGTSIDWLFEKRRSVGRREARDMHLSLNWVGSSEGPVPRFYYYDREDALKKAVKKLSDTGMADRNIALKLGLSSWRVSELKPVNSIF